MEGADGLTLTIGAAGLVAVGGVVVKLVEAIVAWMAKRNNNGNGTLKGYISREDCRDSIGKIEARFDRTDTRIGELHDKVNDTNEKLAEMRGYLGRHLG